MELLCSKITSSVGQTILLKDIDENTLIDLSNFKSGIYNIQLANNFLKCQTYLINRF